MSLSSLLLTPKLGVYTNKYSSLKHSGFKTTHLLAGFVLMLYLRIALIIIRDAYFITDYAVIPPLVASIFLILVMSYIKCSLANLPFTLTANVR
jgi:hypothetical protein